MDDYPGQNQAPGTPPPPAYQPPQAAPPAYQPPQAPQAAYAPPTAPPKKKKTWLWILLAFVALGLLGCCGAAALGGFALFQMAPEPAESIDAINQAALDGDAAAFDKYFDAESVALSAYSAFIDYVKSTEDYAAIVTEMGEEEADRILREEILPEDVFVAEMMAEFSLDSLEEGQVPFPEYTVSSETVEESVAELTIITIEEGEEVTYVLGMELETVGDEDVWRVKEIKNIADMLEDEVGVTE